MANQAQWKTTAEFRMRLSQGKGTRHTAAVIRDVLMDTYPESSWFITVSANSGLFTGDFSVKCKDGVGETAEWMNKTEYPYNMHIYTVPHSDYNRREATDEERAKIEIVSKSVLFDMESTWREVLGFGGMTTQKMRDEVIARLDRNGLKWMYVGVGKGDRCWSASCIQSRRVLTDGYIYDICIYLGD
ncbi:uncharacterized protein LOC134852927 [Symsagittifera roscoffensis]|uniref:uncharacterized protein LOC134852927 n=1 Tax=Symsagittifera roscoffensis TaxID=84072 RepID=UPI00307B1679